jgi:hypothetical protein
MRYQQRSNAVAGFVVVVALALLAAVLVGRVGRDNDELILVDVGSTEIDLDPGSYTAWWQTLAHKAKPEPSNFELTVTSKSCGKIVVKSPSPFRSRGGETSAYDAYSIAEFEIPNECRPVTVTARIVVPQDVEGKIFISKS